jgi:peptidoglycan/LPS O-acetylase OafA/YrhL
VSALVHVGATAAALGLVVIVWGEPVILTNQRIFIPATVICSAVLLLSVVAAPFAPLNAVLSWRPIVWVGMRSYGVYLWHWPIFQAFSTIPYHSRSVHAALIAAEFAVTFVVVVASWRYVEQPFLLRKRRFETDHAGVSAIA